jgi:divalent metal cation (Fe/Co/Zn/Cd) transporter
MRIAKNIVGILLLVAGFTWFLQGINVLPGSFMTGQTQWAVYGVILIVAGSGLIFWANRRRT